MKIPFDPSAFLTKYRQHIVPCACIVGVHLFAICALPFISGCQTTETDSTAGNTEVQPPLASTSDAPITSGSSTALSRPTALIEEPSQAPVAVSRTPSAWNLNRVNGAVPLPGLNADNIETQPTQIVRSSVPVKPEEVLKPVRTAPPAPAAVLPSGGTHRVQKGDSLSKIAKTYGITTKELMLANNLTSSSRIFPDQVLKIPAKGEAVAPLVATQPDTAKPEAVQPAGASADTALVNVNHTVASGDALSKIASQYNSTVAAIRSANKLSSDRIRVGQVLIVPKNARLNPPAAPAAAQPRTNAPASATAAAPVLKPGVNSLEAVVPPQPAPAKPASAEAASGEVYEVQSGDTPAVIAKKHNVNMNDLLRLNNIKDPRKLKVGQKLKIPAPGQPTPPVAPISSVDPSTLSVNEYPVVEADSSSN